MEDEGRRRRCTGCRPGSAHAFEHCLRPPLHREPCILLRLRSRDRRDALNEVEDAFRRMAFLGQYHLDDLRGLRLAEAALAQEVGPILVGARDDPLPRGPDTVDEGRGRGVYEVREGRGRFTGEAVRGVLGMPDPDLLEVLDAPEIAVLADRPEIETGDAERLRADLRIPAIESPKEQVRRAVRQLARLNRIAIVDEEQKHVAVGGIERRRLLSHVDIRAVDARRPVEHAGDLPARVADAIARDPLDRRDQLVVVDTAIVGTGDGPQFSASVGGLEHLDLLGPVRGQAVLQVDPRKRRRKLAQIGRRCTHKAGELAEAPMGRGNRRVGSGHDQRQRLRIVAAGLDADRRTLDYARPAAVRAALDRRLKRRQRQVALVVGSREPFRRDAAVVAAAGYIHPVAARRAAGAVLKFDIGHVVISVTGGRERLSRPPDPSRR